MLWAFPRMWANLSKHKRACSWLRGLPHSGKVDLEMMYLFSDCKMFVSSWLRLLESMHANCQAVFKLREQIKQWRPTKTVTPVTTDKATPKMCPYYLTAEVRCKMMELFCPMSGGLKVSFSGFWSCDRVFFCEANEGLIVPFSGFQCRNRGCRNCGYCRAHPPILQIPWSH